MKVACNATVVTRQAVSICPRHRRQSVIEGRYIRLGTFRRAPPLVLPRCCSQPPRHCVYSSRACRRWRPFALGAALPPGSMAATAVARRLRPAHRVQEILVATRRTVVDARTDRVPTQLTLTSIASFASWMPATSARMTRTDRFGATPSDQKQRPPAWDDIDFPTPLIRCRGLATHRIDGKGSSTTPSLRPWR